MKTTLSPELRKQRAQGMTGRECRRVNVRKPAMRKQDDGSFELDGYASVTETFYDMGWYEEKVNRGAFAKTLAEQPDVQLLINHSGLPLARTTSGTLQLSEDKIGLRVIATLDGEDPDVQSLARKMARGDIDEMSFAFWTVRQSWDEDYTQRELLEVKIDRGDVSVVNYGANPATSATMRSIEALEALVGLEPDAMLAEVRSAGKDPLRLIRGARQALDRLDSGVRAAPMKEGRRYFDIEPIDGSFEDMQEDVQEALQEAEGGGFWIDLVATFSDHVVYQVYPLTPDGWIAYDADPETYQRTYTYDEATDEITLGDRTQVDLVLTVVADPDTEAGAPRPTRSKPASSLAELNTFERRIAALAL